MPDRGIPQGVLSRLFAQYSDVLLLALLTVDHETLTSPVRYARDLVDVTSRGDVYSARGFDVTAPAESAEGVPSASLLFDATDRVAIDLFRQFKTPAEVVIEIVEADDLDAPIARWDLSSRGLQYDDESVQVRLSGPLVLDEPWPKASYTPNRFPGLFAR